MIPEVVINSAKFRELQELFAEVNADESMLDDSEKLARRSCSLDRLAQIKKHRIDMYSSALTNMEMILGVQFVREE